MMNWVRWFALYFAWLIALGGILLSIYFGEMSKVEPCHLCWYQRIALFPLVIILGMATYKSDRKVVIYSLPLVFIGALFALYQIFGEYLPDFCGTSDCTPTSNLPLISAVGFGFMAIFLLFSKGGADAPPKK